MLEIRINHIMDIQQNLRQHLRSLDSEIGELEQVRLQLNGLSCMEEVQMGLQRQQNRMEESRRTLNRMILCMEKLLQYYNSCEERIYDNAQQEIFLYRRYRNETDRKGE